MAIVPASTLTPALLYAPTPKAAQRVLEFFTAQINNDHTRKAYLSAIRRFADLCAAHGISDATFYTWRSKYGGLEVSEAKRLKALADENAKLKKLLAESMLDVSTLRELLAKNS